MEPQRIQRRRVDYRTSLVKIAILAIIIITCLESVQYLFQWSDAEQLPDLLKPYASLLITVNPYLRYLNALIVLVGGYFMVGEVGHLVYNYMRGFADHSSAATVQNIARIVGVGVLIAVLASVFSVDPSAALTLGGFSGLIVGFATQTFLSNSIAGVFVLVTRPFTFGDVVTITGNTGTVKEIRIMHLVLESLDGSQDVLIPNNLVLSQIIQKKRPGHKRGLGTVNITLDPLPDKVRVGEVVAFTGLLTDVGSGMPLVNAAVAVFDSDIGKDDLLAEGITDGEGRFRIEWVARKVDVLDDTAEVYVRFEGDDEHKAANSKQHVIEVIRERMF